MKEPNPYTVTCSFFAAVTATWGITNAIESFSYIDALQLSTGGAAATFAAYRIGVRLLEQMKPNTPAPVVHQGELSGPALPPDGPSPNVA